MTKASILNLLASVDTSRAGRAIAFVEGLDENDARFLQEFGQKPKAATGYWFQQMQMAAGNPACIITCLQSLLGGLQYYDSVPTWTPGYGR